MRLAVPSTIMSLPDRHFLGCCLLLLLLLLLLACEQRQRLGGEAPLATEDAGTAGAPAVEPPVVRPTGEAGTSGTEVHGEARECVPLSVPDLGAPQIGRPIPECATPVGWVRQFMDTNFNVARLAVDAADNVYLALRVTGPTQVAGVDVRASLAVLVSYDPAGTLRFVRTIEDADVSAIAASATHVCVAGVVFINGSIANTVDPTFSGNDFVRCYDFAGEHAWTQTFHGSLVQLCDLDVDAQGQLYAVGTFIEHIEVTDTLTATASDESDHDVFVLALSPSGEARWLRTFGSAARDDASDVEVLLDGRIAVHGSFARATELDGISVEPFDEDSDFPETPFVAMLDTTGAVEWVTRGPTRGSVDLFGGRTMALGRDGRLLVLWSERFVTSVGLIDPDGTATELGGNLNAAKMITAHHDGYAIGRVCHCNLDLSGGPCMGSCVVATDAEVSPYLGSIYDGFEGGTASPPQHMISTASGILYALQARQVGPEQHHEYRLLRLDHER
jgi:hypothetical protein